MNETFDIEENDHEETSKSTETPAEIRQPLFDDIDQLQQRKRILSFENNFDLMQNGGFHNKNTNGINYGCINGSGANQMEFLENELIPDDLLDDVYNFSEAGSTFNGSINFNNISNRKFSNRNSFSLLNVEETKRDLPEKQAHTPAVDDDVNTDDPNIKNLNWLSSQIKALETNIDTPLQLNTKENITLNSEIITNSNLEDLIENKSHLNEAHSDNEIELQQQGKYKHKLDRVEAATSLASSSTSANLRNQLNKLSEKVETLACKSIDTDIKYVLNGIVEKLCQLNETKTIVNLNDFGAARSSSSASKTIENSMLVESIHFDNVAAEANDYDDDDDDENQDRIGESIQSFFFIVIFFLATLILKII